MFPSRSTAVSKWQTLLMRSPPVAEETVAQYWADQQLSANGKRLLVRLSICR